MVYIYIYIYIYKETWAPEEGEMLQCSCETDNVGNRYAVAMMKDDDLSSTA